MSTEKQNTSPGIDVSDRVELMDVRIIKSMYEMSPEAIHGKKSVATDRKVNLQVDKDKDLLVVIIDFSLKATAESVSTPVITITASLLLAYKLQDFAGLTEESYRSFAEVNAVFNAWPYWREFVQNATVRMGLPSLTIPVFRLTVPKMDEKKKIESAEASVKKASETKTTKISEK